MGRRSTRKIGVSKLVKAPSRVVSSGKCMKLATKGIANPQTMHKPASIMAG